MPIETPTLEELRTEFFRLRKHKPTTRKDYQLKLAKGAGDWMKLPITEITGDMIVDRHRELSKDAGEVYANNVAKILNALFNFAKVHYTTADGRRIIQHSPVLRLSELRLWNKETRRQTVIKRHQLAPWLRSIMHLKNRTMTDQFVFMFLTGCRKSEASRLKWADVDLTEGMVTFRNTKFNNDHDLPISDFLVQVLNRRRSERGENTKFVFPSTKGKNEMPLASNYKAIDKLCDQLDIKFTNHDLRRGFISIAQSINVPPLIIKRLVNHSTAADVTASYVVFHPDDVRWHMERITLELLRLAEYDSELQQHYGIELDQNILTRKIVPSPYTDIVSGGGISISISNCNMHARSLRMSERTTF